ncbi:MAG TPA: GGDEF domain-containing protein, partial [Gemmatimonadales bacterium]|nr:GGDEF domain-containing protein [Gemmatimonadales bacterium]
MIAGSTGVPGDAEPTVTRGNTPNLPLSLQGRTREAWRRWFAGGDPLFSHAGAAGELLIAQLRMALVLVLLALPVSNYVNHPGELEHVVGVSVALVATTLALLILIAVRRQMLGSWIGLISTVFDVSLVSSTLLIYLIAGQPHTAVNSRVVFEVYFIAIGATCLRYDVRLCWLAGTLAVTQYFGIVWYADTHWALNSPGYAPFVYGIFAWSSEVGRLVVLSVATMLSVAVVDRGRALRRLSTIDRLTGVLNRGSFDERLNAELSRARRQSESLALVMVDVDHFKKFNDDLGHSAGDSALRTLTRRMSDELRRSDVLARYGGEEFVIIMPAT